jgi:AraC-like DNA-binding protein
VIDSDQKRDICGLAFHPGGLTAFCNLSAQSFTDTIVDAVDLFGDETNSLRETLLRVPDSERLDRLESFLLGQLRHQPVEDHLVREITGELMQGKSVSTVRARHGLSQRRLHELFDRRIGMRPKLFARIQRFAAVLDTVSDRASWSDLAFAHGFADQAHFIREFQLLTGQLPSHHAPLPGEPRHARLPADKIFNTRDA